MVVTHKLAEPSRCMYHRLWRLVLIRLCWVAVGNRIHWLYLTNTSRVNVKFGFIPITLASEKLAHTVSSVLVVFGVCDDWVVAVGGTALGRVSDI